MILNIRTVPVLLTFLLCGCQIGLKSIKETAKDNYSPDIAALVLSTDSIAKIDEENPTLGRTQKDEQVRRLYAQGISAWNRSNEARSRFMHPFNFKVSSLYDVVIAYFDSQGKIFESTKYLKEAAYASKTNVFSKMYFSYQSTLFYHYIRLGMLESAKRAILDIKAEFRDFYQYDIEKDIKTYEIDSLLAHYALLELEMEFDFANNQAIDMGRISLEFDRMIEAYEKYPEIRHTSFVSFDGRGVFNLTEESRYEDTFYFFNYKLLYNFARYFAISHDQKRLNEAKKELSIIHSKNASHIKEADKVIKQKEFNVNWGTRLNFEILIITDKDRKFWKNDYLRFPMQNKFWLYEKDAELEFISGNYEHAFQLGRNAVFHFNALEAVYKNLPPAFKKIDRIEEEKFNLIQLQGKIYEKLNQNQNAYNYYLKAIQYSEEIRKNIPVDLRKNFFRSVSQTAYLGLIRSSALIYKNNPSDETFNGLITSIKKIHARQLAELTKGSLNMEISSNLNSIQTALNKDELIYLLFDVDSAIVLAVITKDSHSVEILEKEEGFDKSLLKLRDKLAVNQIYDYDSIKKRSKSLFGMLNRFTGKKKMHILTEGLLSVLPAELYTDDKGALLFENYEIDYISSLDFKKHKRSFSTNTLLALANPTYNEAETVKKIQTRGYGGAKTRSIDMAKYFAPLPETEDEVMAIGRYMKNTTLLLKADANETRLKSMDLSSFKYLHFATHGVLGGEISDMNEPALVLSYDKEGDGFLSASEIAKLKLNADLTVLSACNTGNGEYFRGEGLMGVGRAFKVAGSKNIIVSMWPVDSAATKELMVFFYRNLAKGLEIAKALSLAKNELRSLNVKSGTKKEESRGLIRIQGSGSSEFAGYKNPFYWAPFILISG